MRDEKKLLAYEVEEKLLRFIQNEPVPVGERIPNEFELSERFNVSRNTIREAVKILASKGVLDVRQGAGTFVLSSSTIDDDPLRLGRYNDKLQLAIELFDVRLMIEPDIAASAALNATDEEISEMRRLCREVEEIHRSGGDTLKKDTELHTTIAKSGKNRVVQEMIPLIASAVYTSMNVTNRKLIEEGIEAHNNIVDAIAAHDSEGAKCAMIEHFACNRRMILDMMKKGRTY